MEILDGHVHIRGGAVDRAVLAAGAKRAGVIGGILISQPPAFFGSHGACEDNVVRLQALMEWTAGDEAWRPFYWIDPLAEDATEQVARAVASGVAGFKVICDRYYPSDERAMAVYRAIAQTGRPILFHSGILWDGKVSSRYNRPVEFEALLDVPGLRFSLAHVSWPWCDELVAVYGKFQSAREIHPELDVEMFVDLTPGTPPVYRRDALTKLFGSGFDITDHVIFGSDSYAEDYQDAAVREWMRRDKAILRELGMDDAAGKVYAANLRRFLREQV